jgi:hypothetical protein
MHIAIRLFGSDEVTNYKELSLLAGDNLRELIYKIDELLTHDDFRNCVETMSGCTKEEVCCLFKDTIRTPEEMVERFSALNKVFMAIGEKIPKREYKRVDELGDMEDPCLKEFDE